MTAEFKIYTGIRISDGEVRVTVNGKELPHIVHCSPTGYEWGYTGAGAADMSLSILADWFNEENPTGEGGLEGHFKFQSWNYMTVFQHEIVAGWGESWIWTSEQMEAWLKAKQDNIEPANNIYERIRSLKQV